MNVTGMICYYVKTTILEIIAPPFYKVYKPSFELHCSHYPNSNKARLKMNFATP
jgi:hypothetical protein